MGISSVSTSPSTMSYRITVNNDFSSSTTTGDLYSMVYDTSTSPNRIILCSSITDE